MANIRELPALKRRCENQSYDNFNVSVYCPVGTIADIKDFEAYKEEFKAITNYVKVGHVYIENLRDQRLCSEEQIRKVKAMEVVHNQVTIEVTPGVNYVLKMV